MIPQPSAEVQLRDFFFAHALQSVIQAVAQNPMALSVVVDKAVAHNRTEKEQVCIIAWEYADAALETRDGRLDSDK